MLLLAVNQMRPKQRVERGGRKEGGKSSDFRTNPGSEAENGDGRAGSANPRNYLNALYFKADHSEMSVCKLKGR